MCCVFQSALYGMLFSFIAYIISKNQSEWPSKACGQISSISSKCLTGIIFLLSIAVIIVSTIRQMESHRESHCLFQILQEMRSIDEDAHYLNSKLIDIAIVSQNQPVITGLKILRNKIINTLQNTYETHRSSE